jgi:hypothetical protein
MSTTWYVEFLTKLSGGEGLAILTNNTQSRGSFKKVKAKDTLRAPSLQDPQQLYAVHLHREARLAPPNATRYIPADGEDIESFNDGSRFDLDRQVRLGVFRYDTAIDSYRPTIPGAYRMTWSQLPPFKNMLDNAERRRSEATVSHMLAQPLPLMPPTVPITNQSPYRTSRPALAQ